MKTIKSPEWDFFCLNRNMHVFTLAGKDTCRAKRFLLIAQISHLQTCEGLRTKVDQPFVAAITITYV